ASQAGDWFLKFAPFVYDPTFGILSNFDRLAASRKWGDKLTRKHWAECQAVEFGQLYGKDSTKLEAWQQLCRDVNIDPVPDSITQCKKASRSRKVWVNLVNLIDHRNLGVELIRFKNYRQFQEYTVELGNIFPKKKARENGFICALLRKL
ncbi:hypothetical protein BDW02DRAFT_494169, partial [Decorospora gaudefroyi]